MAKRNTTGDTTGETPATTTSTGSRRWQYNEWRKKYEVYFTRAEKEEFIGLLRDAAHNTERANSLLRRRMKLPEIHNLGVIAMRLNDIADDAARITTHIGPPPEYLCD